MLARPVPQRLLSLSHQCEASPLGSASFLRLSITEVVSGDVRCPAAARRRRRRGREWHPPCSFREGLLANRLLVNRFSLAGFARRRLVGYLAYYGTSESFDGRQASRLRQASGACHSCMRATQCVSASACLALSSSSRIRCSALRLRNPSRTCFVKAFAMLDNHPCSRRVATVRRFSWGASLRFDAAQAHKNDRRKSRRAGGGKGGRKRPARWFRSASSPATGRTEEWEKQSDRDGPGPSYMLRELKRGTVASQTNQPDKRQGSDTDAHICRMVCSSSSRSRGCGNEGAPVAAHFKLFHT